jgi:diadenosine tetraphosphate (Ap4A) HIT family hydrolase
MSWRTPRTQANYNEYLRTVASDAPCFLCLKEDVLYNRWKLVANSFPYDVIARPNTHFMFCPKRHVAEADELDAAEIEERDFLIRHDLSKTFSCILLNFDAVRTHKCHLHYHVWVTRSDA